MNLIDKIVGVIILFFVGIIILIWGFWYFVLNGWKNDFRRLNNE